MVWLVLVGMLEGAWAQDAAPDAPTEEVAEPRVRFERPASWRADHRLTTAGLALGYTGLGLTFVGIGASEGGPNPVSTGLLGAGTVSGLTSSALLLSGTQGHADWLASSGMPVTEAGSWTGFGLGVAGFGAGFGATTGAVQGGDGGFLAIVQVGLAANSLGVSVVELYVQGDAMRAVGRGPSAAMPVPRGRWASARGLGIAGAVLGWATLPMWTIAGFTVESKAPGVGVPFVAAGMAGAFLGGPLLAGGVAWERSLLSHAGAQSWGAAAIPGYVLAPLGGVMMGLEMLGSPVPTFIPGMVVYPLGLGMLTAQLFIHEHAHGGEAHAGLGVVPWGSRTSAGLSITGTL